MPAVPISAFTVPANTVGIGLSGYSLTGSNAVSMLDLAGTWNTTGTPTAIKLNVTDTASNASSLLMDLQVGGVKQLSVTKSGQVKAAQYGFTSVASQNFAFVGLSNGWYWNDSGNVALGFLNNLFLMRTVTTFGFGNPNTGTINIALAYDADNTLAQRNGVNAQTFNIYNTYTDASNYERGGFKWASNELQIFTQGAGTGGARSLYLNSAANVFIASGNANEIRFYNAAAVSWKISGSSHLLAGTDNTYDIGASGATRPRNVFWAGYQEMSEMTAPAAPAANNVRIYAQDNGSGKTQLMALFATGAAQQIAIEP